MFEASGVCIYNGIWFIFRHPVSTGQLFQGSRIHHFLASSNSMDLIYSFDSSRGHDLVVFDGGGQDKHVDGPHFALDLKERIV